MMKRITSRLGLFVLLQCCLLVSSCINKKKSPSGTIETVNLVKLNVTRGVTYYNAKPFIGKSFVLNSEADTLAIDFYHQGKLDGLSRSWYASGKPMQERLYENGRKEGVHRGWWSNGKMKFHYEFKNDEYNGHAKDWYENGMPYKDFTYQNGHEEGTQKMWNLDGSVYANYVVKNNRIYGLSGRKQCRSLRKG